MTPTLTRYGLTRNETNAVVATLLFLISPILALPFILMGMFSQKKWGFVLFSCFMGILGLMYPPTGDFFRYTRDAQSISAMSWSEMVWFAQLKTEFVMIYLSYFMNKLGLPFDLSRFIYNFTSYYLISLIYLDIVKRNSNVGKVHTWIFVLAFFSFSITTFLFRFYFSMAMFLYGSYKIVYCRKNYGWIFLVIAFLNHFVYLILILLTIMVKLKWFRFNRATIICIGLASLLMNNTLAVQLFQFLPVEIVERYSAYVDGYYAGSFLQDHSIWFQIMFYIAYVVAYTAVFIYISVYTKKNKVSNGLVNAILVMSAVAAPFATIASRFLQILIWSIKIQFFATFRLDNKHWKYLKVFLILTLTTNMTGLWANRRQLGLSDMKMIVTAPTYKLMTHTYDRKWQQQHVFTDGDYK